MDKINKKKNQNLQISIIMKIKKGKKYNNLLISLIILLTFIILPSLHKAISSFTVNANAFLIINKLITNLKKYSY